MTVVQLTRPGTLDREGCRGVADYLPDVHAAHLNETEYPNLLSLTRMMKVPFGLSVSSCSACLRVIMPWNHS